MKKSPIISETAAASASKIFYLIESEPLGSGGALFYAKDFFEDTLLVCSGDTVFDIDVASMLAFHREKRAEITLLAHPNSHPYDSDLIVTDGSDRVTEIDFKGNERRRWYANKVNAGFFLFEKSAFDYFTEAKKCNLERDFIYDRVKNGRPYTPILPQNTSRTSARRNAFRRWSGK